MKYKVLVDYRTEGYHFEDEEFNSVSDAVKYAIENNRSAPFLIVQIVDWKGVEKCPYDDCWKVKYKDCPIHGLTPNP